MPVLWGRAAFTFPSADAFPDLRHRCGGAPIDVCVSKPRGLHRRERIQYYELIRASSGACERITSLHLHGLAVSDLTPFLCGVTIPSLRILMLTLSRTRDEDIPLWTSESSYQHLHAPPGTALNLSLRAPALRRLSLTLRDPEWSPDELEWLAPTLRGSPLIESISLSLSLGRKKPQWGALFQNTPIHLPCLTELVLNDLSCADMPGLAEYINPFPPRSFSAIIGGGITVESEDVSSFVHAFGPKLCLPGRQALLFCEPHIRVGDMYLSGGVAVTAMPPFAEPALFALPADGLTDSATLAVRIDRDAVLPLLAREIAHKDTVEQLFVETKAWSDRGFWETLFAPQVLAHLPAVHTLALLREGREPTQDGCDMVALRMLCRPEGQPILLPNLHTLIVTAGNYGVVRWWRHLLAVLTYRHERGAPVRVVRIRGYEYPGAADLFVLHGKNYMDRSKKVVGEVRDERLLVMSLSI